MTRPLLHFTARTGWINDPHGITFRNGEYHAFFQFVPDGIAWSLGCRWGHASGRDLLSLSEHPVAIAPGDGDDGIWTGSAVTDGAGRGRIFYTSTVLPDLDYARVRVAYADDEDWVSWTKGAVVAEPPADLDIVAYRDPYVRRDGDGWRMFVGAGLRDGTAVALSYSSDDLDAWAYDGVVLTRSTNETEPVWMGALWECPQILGLDGRAVMVSSVWSDGVIHDAKYALGAFRGDRFEADTWATLTFGDSYYAPSVFTDADGRTAVVFWMRGVADPEAGWAGAHSIPYLLAVESDRLVATPHPDVAAHRGPLARDGLVDGAAADIRWSGAPVGAELTVASVDSPPVPGSSPGSSTVPGGVRVRVTRTFGGVSVDTGHGPVAAPLSGDLRIVVDGPVLEISSPTGLCGGPLDDGGSRLAVTVTSGAVEVYPLHP